MINIVNSNSCYYYYYWNFNPWSSFDVSGNNEKRLRVSDQVTILPRPMSNRVNLNKLFPLPRPQLLNLNKLFSLLRPQLSMIILHLVPHSPKTLWF